MKNEGVKGLLAKSIARSAITGLALMILSVTEGVQPVSLGAQDHHNQAIVNELIERVAENWGGAEALSNLRTLRITVTYAGHEDPVTLEMARPNLVRITGGDRYVSVFDGERAAFIRQLERDGNPRAPYLVNEEEVKDWELEMAWLFPAFFDHPARYMGPDTLDGALVHRLRVELPLGARVDYLVDAERYLVLKAEAETTIGETTYRPGRIYHIHRKFGQVLYPQVMDFYYDEEEAEPAVIEGAEWNVRLPADHFRIPMEIR